MDLKQDLTIFIPVVHYAVDITCLCTRINYSERTIMFHSLMMQKQAPWHYTLPCLPLTLADSMFWQFHKESNRNRKKQKKKNFFRIVSTNSLIYRKQHAKAKAAGKQNKRLYSCWQSSRPFKVVKCELEKCRH